LTEAPSAENAAQIALKERDAGRFNGHVGPCSARMALLVWLRARSSMTCPSKTMAMMTAAGSK